MDGQSIHCNKKWDITDVTTKDHRTEINQSVSHRLCTYYNFHGSLDTVEAATYQTSGEKYRRKRRNGHNAVNTPNTQCSSENTIVSIGIIWQTS